MDNLQLAIDALQLIAAPKRADGTYNRCREACEEIAQKALQAIQDSSVDSGLGSAQSERGDAGEPRTNPPVQFTSKAVPPPRCKEHGEGFARGCPLCEAEAEWAQRPSTTQTVTYPLASRLMEDLDVYIPGHLTEEQAERRMDHCCEVINRYFDAVRAEIKQGPPSTAPAVNTKPDHEQFEAWCVEYFGKKPNEVRFDSERGPFIMGDLIAAFLAGSKCVSRPVALPSTEGLKEAQKLLNGLRPSKHEHDFNEQGLCYCGAHDE